MNRKLAIIAITFNQFNVSLLNKSIDLLKKIPNPKHLNGGV